MNTGVWFVEWRNLTMIDLNAVFSSKEKAIKYIEKEIPRMELQDVHKFIYEDEFEWGVYEFIMPWNGEHAEVLYSWYTLNARDV